jgi:hypothetical protein
MKKLVAITTMLCLLLMTALPVRANGSWAGPNQTDLSDLPAIEAYLGSVGVDPGDVVIQQGRLNYAGPSCPGAGWNCTTAKLVVQLGTSAVASNIFDCQPAISALIPALNECLIVQSTAFDPLETASTTNSATCSVDILDGAGKSKCTIRQSSKKGNNYAAVRARVKQGGGFSQAATEDAQITQMSDTGTNTAKIALRIEQSMSVGGNDDPTQTQNARQTAQVDQTSGSGDNSSDVQELQLQTEGATSSADTTQGQNTDTTLGRNQQATINQTSTSGHNSSNLQHQITQRQQAECEICSVNQTQGSDFGGQSGTVTQTTGPVTMTTMAALNEDQQQDATTSGTWVRSQFDPQDCCGEQNGGTAGNGNAVGLDTSQRNSGGSKQAVQSATCSENVLGAQCSTRVTATQDVTTSQNSCPPPSAGSCSSFQSCNNGLCGGGEVPALPVADQQTVPLATSTAGALVSRALSPEGTRSRVTE